MAGPIEAKKDVRDFFSKKAGPLFSERGFVVTLAVRWELAKLFFNLMFRSNRSRSFIDQESKASILSFIMKKKFGAYATNDGVMLYGHEVVPSRGDFWGLRFLLNEIIIQDQYHVAELLKKNDIVIDVGANIGLFSIQGAEYAPEATFYALEPSDDAFVALERNAAPYRNITCVKSALGEQQGSRRMTHVAGAMASSLLEDSPFVSRYSKNVLHSQETVPVVTLDEFVAQKKLPRVDFIKIDTEGYERFVLRGARETIRRYKPIIVMSAYHNADDKTVLPAIIKDVAPEYIIELHGTIEQDFICRPRPSF